MVLLDTGTPGTSREIFSVDADGETRTGFSVLLFLPLVLFLPGV